MTADVAADAESRGIKYFLMSFTDLFGVTRSKLVPRTAINEIAADGAGFAGFAVFLDMTPADTDMLAMPDLGRMIQLPWQPETAWVPCDPHLDGKAVQQAPRVVLQNVIGKATDAGMSMLTGVEPEFFILADDGEGLADARDIRGKPCYDQQALMRRYSLITRICDCMIELGWEPYQNDHEDANGQFEMNWGPSDPLTTADRHNFFKFMVKSLAEEQGFRATFMPKPAERLTGNGCHVHFSVWDGDGKANLMSGDGELGLSDLAYHVIGGILGKARDMALITNPVVNSYKRINAPATMSGATWSPNTVTYGGNNRTHLIRIPADNRIEVRLADGATNPYLLQAAIIAAALDGIENRSDPGKRLDIDMYAEGHKVKDAPKLPLNMLDAIRLFEDSDFIAEVMGAEFHSAFVKLKMIEWNEFMSHFSDWERTNAFDS